VSEVCEAVTIAVGDNTRHMGACGAEVSVVAVQCKRDRDGKNKFLNFRGRSTFGSRCEGEPVWRVDYTSNEGSQEQSQ
jgi:hypothetical protein